MRRTRDIEGPGRWHDAAVNTCRWICALRLAAAGLLAGLALPAPACEGPVVSLVVPYPAGGSMDAVMRLVADVAGEEAGKTFVLRNVGGASGALAVQQVLRQPADGCTVLAGNVNAVILAPLLMTQAGFQPTDLVPLGQVGSADFLVVAAPGFAAQTLEELPAAARRAGRPLSAGHPGTETLQHLALPLIERRLQLPLLRVPYTGSSVLVNDLIGGHLDIAVVAEPVATPLVARGQLKVLARLGDWLPSAAGGRQPPLLGWAGWFVAAPTPMPARQRLQAALLAALARPALQQRLEALGSDVPDEAQQQRFAATVWADIGLYRQRMQQR